MEINNNSPSFSGLNRNLAKSIYTKKTIQRYYELYPASMGIVGNIPSAWIKNMPATDKKKHILGIYSELGQRFTNFDKTNLKTQAKEIEIILKKHRAIKPDSTIYIEYVDEGAFSHGYKLQNKAENTTYFLKLFKPEDKYTMISHGRTEENNTKTFLKHKLKTKSEKSCFSKFYFGDIINGYYIEEFLTNKNSLPQLPYKIKTTKIGIVQNILAKLHLHHHDLNNLNYKTYYTQDNGYQIRVFDVGGIKKLPN